MKFLLVLAGVLFFSASAYGSQLVLNYIISIPCGPGDDFDLAMRKYDEKLFATAVDPKGNNFELKVNPVTGSFTLIMLLPDGTKCLLAAGQRFKADGHSAIEGQPI